MAGFNPSSTELGVEGYVVRDQRIVQVRHSSYDLPLKGYNVQDEWHNHSPRKVHDFFDKIQDEASRPTHPTLLSSPKWTAKPSWRSHDDHDSPKYREHHDWERSSGSPLRDKFEGLHLQDNRGSSPFSPKKDGHFNDYGVNNRWDSPPRSTHWDNRGSHDDYSKQKFNGGYKTSSPLLSQAINDIGTAMKILEEGTKPLSSPTYAPHFPASISSPQRKESYPERSQGGKPVSSQPSQYPTTNPITERKESYPDPTKGIRPLFSPGYTQPPHSHTSHPTSQRKENYPETVHNAFSSGSAQQPHLPTSNPTSQNIENYPNKTQGWKPLFSSASKQQPHHPTSHSTPETKEGYPETAHGTKGIRPLFSPGYTQPPHSHTSYPTSQRKENYPETVHNAFSPVSAQQPHLPTSNPTSQNIENYPNKTQGWKPLFSSASKQQPHHPTSHSTPETKEGYPETAHGTKPPMSAGSAQKPHFPTSNPTPQNQESYPKNKKQGWNSLISPGSKSQPHPPTSYSTPERKESYPDHETQGWDPSFSPSSPQKEYYPPPIRTPQMEGYYSDDISPYEYTEERIMDSTEAKKKYANMKPMSPTKKKNAGTINSIEAVEKYNGTFVPKMQKTFAS